VLKIESGEVRGQQSQSIYSFLGMPYAASTAGANRWRPPQPVARWSEARDATVFGVDCPQGPPYEPPGGTPWTSGYITHGVINEDCLSLNVWTPRLGADARLPVLVWIHGGAFAGGSGAVPIYNGASLARRGIVVVTINYRLGVLGFMALPELTAEAGTSGNYGLLDQIAALQWVRRNIEVFGGDPERVTIAGQSAGAASVQDLIASPAAVGLFARAIVESDPILAPTMPTLAAAEVQGARVAAAARMSTLAGLRDLPLARILAAGDDPAVGPPGIRYTPIRDGRVLPDPQRAISRVPILIGLTGDETSAGGDDWRIDSVAGLRALLQRRVGERASQFASLYPATTPAAARDAARALLRERGVAAVLAWFDAHPHDAEPAFAYLFDHVSAGTSGERFGAFHTAEVPYVFGTLEASGMRVTAQERRLAATVSSYWVNFVRTGNPNGAGLPAWPELASGQLMLLRPQAIARTALPAAKRSAYAQYTAAGGTLGLF
jgi:para-nitrobenzyl esterase